jgi:hypothetical protein
MWERKGKEQRLATETVSRVRDGGSEAERRPGRKRHSRMVAESGSGPVNEAQAKEETYSKVDVMRFDAMRYDATRCEPYRTGPYCTGQYSGAEMSGWDDGCLAE